jgi:hypothetical protein
MSLFDVCRSNAADWIGAASQVPQGFWPWVCGHHKVRRAYLKVARIWLGGASLDGAADHKAD